MSWLQHHLPKHAVKFCSQNICSKKAEVEKKKLYWLSKLCTNYQLLKPPSRAYEMIRAIRVLWPMWPCPSRRFNRPAFGIQKVAIGPKMLLWKVSRQHIGQPLIARNPENHMQLPLASIFRILRPQEQDPKSLQQANEPRWAKALYKKTAKITIILSHQLLTNLPANRIILT